MRLVLLACFAAFLLPGKEAAASEPWRYMRALQALQDKVVQGDKKAHEAQLRMLRYIGEKFAAEPDAAWKKRRNAEALLAHLLSGGRPDLAARLLREKREVALPPGALEGAVAFVRGRNGRAWARLKDVREEKMSLSAGAQVALAKAALRAGADPKYALKQLARVRLWKPGTLMEEAALRRALFLAGSEGDVRYFMALSERYVRRFRRSWYVSDFLRKFAWLLVRLDYGKAPHMLEDLSTTIRLLTRRQQALVYAAVSRGALLEGKLRQAITAGGMALAVYPKSGRFAARVRAYITAAKIADENPGKAMRRLRRLDLLMLDARDRKIVTAALTVGEAILAEPVVRRRGGGGDSAIIIRARAMAAGIGKLLKESAK